MRSLTKSVAVLALPLSIALSGAVLAAPAHAAQLTVKDAKGDVRKVALADANNPKKLRNAPADKSVKDHDIVRTKFAHTRKQLVVQTKFRSLQGERLVELSTLGIRTPKAAFSYQWIRTSVLDETKVTSVLVRGTKKNAKEVTCKVGVANNVKKAVRTIRIPRKCLGNPAWVRVTSNASTGDMNHTYIDDALGKGMGKLTKRLAAG